MLTEIHTKHEWRTISNKEASLLYLDVKNINQIIHTVVKCDSHDKPPPWGLCKVLTAWVNFPSSETPLPVFSQTECEWAKEHSWEGVKEKGNGGGRWGLKRGLVSIQTHTHSHRHSWGTVWEQWTDLSEGLGSGRPQFDKGHDPKSKHLPFILGGFCTFKNRRQSITSISCIWYQENYCATIQKIMRKKTI